MLLSCTPPRPTAQLWIDRPMTPKSAPLPPVLPPPLPGGPLQGLPCYGGQSQYMCRNIATIVACVISCLCMRAFLERCLPGRAADVSVLITMPSWNGNMCGSALLEGQCSCKSCKRAPHHFSVLHTTVLFTQSAPPSYVMGFQDPDLSWRRVPGPLTLLRGSRAASTPATHHLPPQRHRPSSGSAEKPTWCRQQLGAWCCQRTCAILYPTKWAAEGGRPPRGIP